MTHTVEEARTAFCPYTTGNTGGMSTTRCRANACMMWRWVAPLQLQGRERGTGEWQNWGWDPRHMPVWAREYAHAQEVVATHEFRTEPAAERKGYCGIPGRPEHD